MFESLLLVIAAVVGGIAIGAVLLMLTGAVLADLSGVMQ